MLSDAPWKGIFQSRVPDKPKPAKRGDPNASLHELALRQVVESCDDAAAEATVEELREFASVVAMWPPACLPWVLPRLGHRLLFACLFEESLRSLVSAELIEAAIRRDEQRFREASDAKLSGSINKYKGDPDRALAGCGLMEVFGDWGGLLGNVERPPVKHEQLLFAHERAACAPDLGTPAFEPSLDEFTENFDTFTSGLLRGLNWDGGIIAAGGAVLACALRSTVPPASRRADPDAEYVREQQRWAYFEAREHHAFRRYVHPEGKPAEPPGVKSPFASSSDIDLFLVGLDPPAAYRKVAEVCRCIGRNLRGKVLIVTTGSAITFVTGWPNRHVQVVLKLFPSTTAALASFDVDCCAFAYDGSNVLCTARAMRAAVTRCNAIDLQRRSCRSRCTYESRLLKYAMRGFAIAVSPSLFDRSRLNLPGFDSCTLMFASGQTGLRRLLVAEHHAISRRSTTESGGVIAAEGPPVSVREAWTTVPYACDRSKGFLPGFTSKPQRETFYHGQCTDRIVNFDEFFNIQESEMVHKASDKDRPMYTQGILPWRLGYDATRIEAYLVSIRKSGKSLRRYRREEEGVATPGKFTLTVARHSTLPSEGVTGWGYDLGKLLRQSSFEAAASCGSFFPVPPEGFTTGCHLPEASMKESFYRLIFRQQTEVLLRNAEQTKKTVGSVLEESNGERCTVVEVMESKHSWQQKVKVRFEGSDEVVERHCHDLYILLPLQDAIRKLVKEQLLPKELDNRYHLTSIYKGSRTGPEVPWLSHWLRTRGLELRGSLSEEEAQRAQRIIDALAADEVLREHGGDFSLSLIRCEPERAGGAEVVPPALSSLEAPAPMYDYRGVTVGSQVELHDLRNAEFNGQRGTVVGPMCEGRYPVEVSPGGTTKKRIRIKLENLRSVNI